MYVRELYIANKNHTIGYAGNKICAPIGRVTANIDPKALRGRLAEFKKTKKWEHIAKINHSITVSTNEYFNKLGSIFTLLPLTTRMISSPGALYGKEKIAYTTDTSPIKLKWFDYKQDVFLSESSQIYLELHLINANLKSVYSIYNSFRKEKADATHLSEFHHIEYEGKVSQKDNLRIIDRLVSQIIKRLLHKNLLDLEYFLYDEDINDLKKMANRNKIGVQITFEQALDLLYRATKDPKYKFFTTKYFGAWEEVKLTQELDNMAIVSEFPLYETAFYHAPLNRKGLEVGENTDFIWPYYREFVGSGHRVRNTAELLKKANKFTLPKKDYKYYLESREQKYYHETSGFGLGWERMLQGLLKMPYIYSVATFPRVHNTIYP